MREFLVDINNNIEIPEYNLVLYSLYEKPITELYNITDFNIKPFFIGIDEMSFNIPMIRNENNGQIIRNEIYDMVDGEYYVKLNDNKFFVISKINEKVNDDGLIYKEISAYSREVELNQKRLVDYKASSRMLYDRENTMLEDESGQLIERGILNYIFNNVTKAWTIGIVDEKVVSLTNHGISRELNFSNSSLIQVFQELQKTYGCVFKFDTINQIINVESMLDYELEPSGIDESPQYKGLYISDENFIKNMSKNIEYDKVKTRLYLYGKDNISIQSIHPTGQAYIDNFTTFKTTKFMTQELIDGLNDYELLIKNANPNFTPLLNQLQTKNAELEDLYNKDDSVLANKGLVALQRELSLVQTEIDTRIAYLAIIKDTISDASGTDLADLHTQMKATQSEIDAFESQKANINSLITTKSNQIEVKKGEITSVEVQIQGIRDNLSVQANLSPHLVKELDKFIRVETYNDSNFTEDNIMELYEEGKKNLSKISQPPIQFDVDVVDFLSIVECQHTWDKLVLGDIVLLENKNIGFSYYVRLVGYEHSPDNNSLNLKFSNTNSFDDATLWIKDLLEQMSNTTSTLDFNKYKWDKAEDMQDRISKMVDEKLEEARQNILNAVGQKHLFDDSGLWLYKENPDGTINDEQIRAINNTIALTENNWQTVGTAITPKGINAEVIRGKLGQFAKVNANQINVGSEGSEQPLLDYMDAELTNAVSDLGDVINNAFIDTQLTNIEANSIKLSLDNVTSESVNLISTATTLAITTEKYNYSTALATLTNYLNTNWLGKVYPLEITVAQRTTVTNYFKYLEDKKSILLTKITEVRAIKEVNDKAVVKGTLYNGVKIDAESGLVATRNDDTSKTTVNATEGIKIQGKVGGVWQDNFYVDTNGFIRAKNIIIDGLDSGNKTFNTTPSPPYIVNDLWKVTGVAGVDFRICTTARATGSYVASDWTNITDSKNYTDLIKNLTSGTSISGGVTTINNTGVKVSHTGLGGQYSEIRADGFVRKWRYGEAKYLNDIHVETFNFSTARERNKPAPTSVYLPASFRGREVEVFLSISNLSLTNGTIHDGHLKDLTQNVYSTLQVSSMSMSLATPTIYVDNYIEQHYVYEDVRTGHWKGDIDYQRLGFIIQVIGK